MLRDEIVNYTDGEGYISPHWVLPNEIRSSDNQCLFTSEYYILLNLNKQNFILDNEMWISKITQCMPKPGLTVRSPGDEAIDSPDNLYGILAACSILNQSQVAEKIYSYGLTHFGFYNPTNKFTWSAFQWRQPQLIFAMICASDLNKWYHFPLALYSSLVIAISCINVPVRQTNERILSWLLIQTVKKNWLCSLASKIWTNRLLKDYTNGMKDVFSIYFGASHPIAKYSPKF